MISDGEWLSWRSFNRSNSSCRSRSCGLWFLTIGDDCLWWWLWRLLKARVEALDYNGSDQCSTTSLPNLNQRWSSRFEVISNHAHHWRWEKPWLKPKWIIQVPPGDHQKCWSSRAGDTMGQVCSIMFNLHLGCFADLWLVPKGNDGWTWIDPSSISCIHLWDNSTSQRSVLAIAGAWSTSMWGSVPGLRCGAGERCQISSAISWSRWPAAATCFNGASLRCLAWNRWVLAK